METILDHIRWRMDQRAEGITQRKRPFVTLTYAQSIDGSIAASKDAKLVLSCPSTMTMTHELRAMHQAILVGVQTVCVDNPRLTARLPRDAENPRPVILDTTCRISPKAAIFEQTQKNKGPIVYTAPLNRDGLNRKQTLLVSTDALVVTVGMDENGQVSLDHVLGDLYGRGVQNIMVEGGSRILTSFLRRNTLIDFLVVTICPTYVGGGVRSVETKGTLQQSGLFPRFADFKWTSLGDDIVLSGALGQMELS